MVRGRSLTRLLQQFDQGASARIPGFKEYARFPETIEVLREAGARREPPILRAEPSGRAPSRRTHVQATKPRKRLPAPAAVAAPERR